MDQGFDASYPTPKAGDLHKRFKNLPSKCEVVVQIISSSVNPADKYATSGIGGSDIAGHVVALGDFCAEQTRLRIGSSVWGDIGAVAFLKSGVKTKENGAYAEYAVALDSQLGLKPQNIGFTEAGALPKVSLTSWKALRWYANAANWTKASGGPVVLILGGSGGTGSTGLQLAKAFGASRIITTTSADNFAYCKSLGADQLIDYRTTNWWDAIKENSVDIVYDTVGQDSTGNRAMAVLRSSTYFGYYVTITGATATRVKPGITQNMFINSDTNLQSQSYLDALTELIEADKLRIKHIDSTYKLMDISSAFNRSSSHLAVGKISISVSNGSSIVL